MEVQTVRIIRMVLVIAMVALLMPAAKQPQEEMAAPLSHNNEIQKQQTIKPAKEPQQTMPPKPQTVLAVSEAKPPSTKYDLMRAAGIPESDWISVDYIIEHESSWRHNVWNKGGSGAYGLCQSLPATKMASAGDDYMTNPVTQLRWCHNYAISRYGSWQAAAAFWKRTDSRPYPGHWW